ncbi:L-proline trans-4-hydroxylase-like 3, partial [Homarus americanus]
ALPVGSEFTYDAATWSVTPAMKETYNKNGYILVRNMLSQAEIDKVKAAVEGDDGIQAQAYSRDDGKSRRSRVSLWNHPVSPLPHHTVTSPSPLTSPSPPQLMGGDEIYHYHSKLMMKDANTGGRHVWHQDYGYWYNNGCLYPNMASVFIPVDNCTRKNSCLQVLRGSHLLGRIDHRRIGEQLGADPERVEKAQKVLEHVYVEMKAGDMLFFHCNLLHTSDQNSSDLRRWVFIVLDSALMECDGQESLEGKWFMKLNDDISIRDKVH